jgi:hypothetical protein
MNKLLIALALVAVLSLSSTGCRKPPPPEQKAVTVATPPQPREPGAALQLAAPPPDSLQSTSPAPAKPIEYTGPLNAPALPVITGKGGAKPSIPPGSFTGEGRK